MSEPSPAMAVMTPELQATVNAAVQQAVASQTRTTNARRADTPTLATYLPAQLEALPAGSRRTYQSPLKRLLDFRPCLPFDPDGPPAITPECPRLGCPIATEPDLAAHPSIQGHRRLGEVPLAGIERPDLDRFAVFTRTPTAGRWRPACARSGSPTPLRQAGSHRPNRSSSSTATSTPVSAPRVVKVRSARATGCSTAQRGTGW